MINQDSIMAMNIFLRLFFDPKIKILFSYSFQNNETKNCNFIFIFTKILSVFLNFLMITFMNKKITQFEQFRIKK